MLHTTRCGRRIGAISRRISERIISVTSPERRISQDRDGFVAHEGVFQDRVEFFNVGFLVEMVCRDIQLCQQGLGVNGHLRLAGHWLFQLTPVRNQHRQRHPVKLREGYERVDCHTDCSVLHDDRRAFAAHECAGAQAHAFVFFVRRDVVNLGARFALFDNAAELFARNRRNKGHIVCDEIVNDFLAY